MSCRHMLCKQPLLVGVQAEANCARCMLNLFSKMSVLLFAQDIKQHLDPSDALANVLRIATPFSQLSNEVV